MPGSADGAGAIGGLAPALVASGSACGATGNVRRVTRFDTVSLLTDYGSRDEFAGVVRAVIRDIAPHVTVVDLTHEIPPFDVRAGSLALARCITYVPSGVVMAVVDPGVATDRRAVAIEVAGGSGVVVGPDNGLLAPAVAMAGGAERAVELTNRDYRLLTPGATFAGRDIFAPAAAHICNGVELSSGAIRNHRPDIMARAFAIAGYGPEELERRFGGMLRALRYGAPPHGGIAPGIDRIVMLLADTSNLREVTAFPLNQQAEELLLGAPSPVSDRQLRELHLQLSLAARERLREEEGAPTG